MQLTTKGRYATRIMVNLTVHNHEKPVQKNEIAREEGMSPDYVAQLLLKLKAAGLVQSHRGVRGGFTLSCDPAKISAARVLEAVEGPIAIVPCLSRSCLRQSKCATRTLWRKANAALLGVLEGTSLADMAKQSSELQASLFEI
mgnify:CR=1 FL=1